MEIYQLPFNDRVALGGATHAVRITHEDLTLTTADADQTLTIDVAAGDIFELTGMKLETAFADASDGAFDSTQITVGDAGDPDRFLAQTQINGNGTEIDYAGGAAAQAGGYAFNEVDNVNILIESMAGKSLSALDSGSVVLFFRLVNLAAFKPNN